MKQQHQGEEEEDTTLSWSSSLSISPDNPLFQGKSESPTDGDDVTHEELSATQKSELQQQQQPEELLVRWRDKKETATSQQEELPSPSSFVQQDDDEDGPLMVDAEDDDDDKDRTKQQQPSSLAVAATNKDLLLQDNKSSLGNSNNSHTATMAKSTTDRQAQISPEQQQDAPFLDVQSNASKVQFNAAAAATDSQTSPLLEKTFTTMNENVVERKDSAASDDFQKDNDETHQQEQLRTMEEQVRLGEQLHHMRMPSTIMEENPLTVEEDEDSSPEDDEQQQKQPLLLLNSNKPLEQKSTSFTDLLKSLQHILPSNNNSANSSAHNSGRNSPTSSGNPLLRSTSSSSSFQAKKKTNPGDFTPLYTCTKFYETISKRLLRKHYTPFAAATWIGFWALLHVTCANYVLTPMRDAIALQVGVEHMPKLTLASTVLAFCSSVPIGWLFEAPDPSRRRVWKRMGLTRGETQGTSLALFYRCFALILISYAIGFQLIELLRSNETVVADVPVIADSVSRYWPDMNSLWVLVGQILYIAFFLVVHLMKLHSLSLVWGVTTEAMEYEEVARRRSQMDSNRTRLQRLALVGFGGTVGGILGSMLASSMAQILRLPGLLIVAALLLEVSAELSIEMGRIMQKHWEEQQLFQSSNDLASLDSSMKRSASLGSMKRVASGNSLNRVKSTSELNSPIKTASLEAEQVNDNTFFQRLLRGLTTILRSRLLMAIFTYNALYASTTVLLSFQRAALVANRNDSTTTEKDTAFLAKVNMASSIAVFALQASGMGAHLAHVCGSRGTLALMPMVRFAGVISLAWWHRASNGQPPNLMIFLVVDECCKIMNLAVAKPVRESLWRGLSNEARYEAKPIVDTLANRWGGGSAAFLVSFINKTLDLFGVEPDSEGVRMIFGFPPIIFLCVIIAAWWTAVSADLGHVRSRIDIELKKRQ